MSYDVLDNAQEMCTCAVYTTLKDDTRMCYNDIIMHTNATHNTIGIRIDVEHNEFGTRADATDNDIGMLWMLHTLHLKLLQI